MKIKRISIVGFKSFVDRCSIQFPFGISGIVGPNGCGKSNIVDAIRWCMGEQSPKQLRGRQMEDVIFNGAGDLRPLGMAEVSLVFENGDGSFPPAFANHPELSVTRRLYRSGESEYLINNVPCRLKDIQEIFMDTGLGNKAYSIIGQGRIGAILEQRPEDTRVMLEEAAGITKYRKKVDASTRKMELTEANLQRVEDILGEVQRQMRSLKRQAAKARRYKAIGEEIQRLELILYANQFHELKRESEHRTRSTEDLVQHEVEKAAGLSKVHAQVQTMELGLEEKDDAVTDLRQRFDYLKERVHRKEAEIESLQREILLQEEMEQRLLREQEELQSRITSLGAERVSLERKAEETKESLQRVETEIAIAEERVQTRRQLLQEVKEDYERARSKVNTNMTKEVPQQDAGTNHRRTIQAQCGVGRGVPEEPTAGGCI
jgi:chromosome segregation protein